MHGVSMITMSNYVWRLEMTDIKKIVEDNDETEQFEKLIDCE
jgi:hypothetical protein